MNPPKRQVFVDSFSIEEPNRRGTHKKSTTPRRATTKKPKANRKKAMPQSAAQPRKPKARVEPTPAEVEARQERQREYERRRAQTPERKELKRRSTQEGRDKAKLLGICVGCGAPPFRTRPAAKSALSATGSTQGKPSKELPSRRNKPPNKPAPSDDNPGYGPRTLVPARNRGKQAYWNLFTSNRGAMDY